jgi:hypothetical protein
MEHNEWFTKRTDGDSINAAATKAEMPQNTLNRQLKAGALPAESVIKISRAYNYNPVQGLVDTGYLDPLEAQGELKIINWSDVTDAELCKELLDRCDPDGTLSRQTWEGPIDDNAITEIYGAAPTHKTQLMTATPPPQSQVPSKDDVTLAAKAPGYNANEETDQ